MDRPEIPDNNATLSIQEKIGYGLGDTASNLFWKTFEFYLLYYYTDVFGLPVAAVATMFLVTRVWDAINDPLVGYLADRTHTRWGRFRPYLLWVPIPLAASVVALFYRPDLGESGKLLYAYVTYLIVMTGYTLVNTPYGALMGVISGNTLERTSVATYRFVLAFCGAIVVQYFTLDLVAWFGETSSNLAPNGSSNTVDEAKGFFWTIVCFATVSVVLFWIAFATTRERVKAPPRSRSERENPAKSRHTLREDAWFVATDFRLHQFFLIIALMIIAITHTSGQSNWLWLLGGYAIGTTASLIVGRMNKKRSTDQRLSTFRQDIDDLLDNRPWMILFGFGLLLLMGGFIRNSAILYYFKYFALRPDLSPIFLVSGTVTAVLGMLLARPLAAQFGKKTTVVSANLIGALAVALFWFLEPAQVKWMFSLQMIASFMIGPTAVLLWSMYADAADYSHWKNNRRATGLVFAAATFSQKIGASFGAALAAFLLSYFQYIAPTDGVEQIQSEQTLMGLKLMMSLIPAFFTTMAAITLLFYPISSDRLRLIERALLRRN